MGNSFTNLISIKNLSEEQILSLIKQANSYLDKGRMRDDVKQSLKNKWIALLFLEPSTRTRCSFEIAAKRLGAHTLNLVWSLSSGVKGESLLDTIETLKAQAIDLLVLRHSNGQVLDELTKHFCGKPSIVNAGDGSNEHPTQALLDFMTIYNVKPDVENLKIAIIGDIIHSRVANSDIKIFNKFNFKEIHLIAPEPWLPNKRTLPSNISLYTDLVAGIKDVDIIITLRIQKERMTHADIPEESWYLSRYGLTKSKLKYAAPDAMILHPSPINRDVEIASELLEYKQSYITQQITNGVAMRMAVMEQLLT